MATPSLRLAPLIRATFPACAHANPPGASPANLPLLFWTHEDVTDPLGKIEFDAHPLDVETGIAGYPNMLNGCKALRGQETSFFSVPRQGRFA